MTLDSIRAMDRRSGVVAATLICIGGAVVFLVQPGYVEALVDRGHFSADQAGYIAASEMAGIAITTFLTSLISHRWPWAPLLYLAAGAEIIGNLACTLHGDFGWLLAMRLIAGLGAGVLISLSFTAIGETRNPGRAFAFFMMWVLLYGALGLFAMPGLIDMIGMRGLYLVFSVIVLLGLLMIPFMPQRASGSAVSDEEVEPSGKQTQILAAASFFIFFFAAGLMWAYLSLLGAAMKLSDQTVANAVALSQGVAVAGALVPGIMPARFGRVAALLGSITACGLASALLRPTGTMSSIAFVSLVCFFNFAWNVAQPVYLAESAALDRSGRLVTHMVTMQMLGLAVGPFSGGLLLGAGYGAIALGGAVLFLIAAGVMLCAFVSARRRPAMIASAV